MFYVEQYMHKQNIYIVKNTKNSLKTLKKEVKRRVKLHKQLNKPVTYSFWLFATMCTLAIIFIAQYITTLTNTVLTNLMFTLYSAGYFAINITNPANLYQFLTQPVIAYYCVKAVSGGFTSFCLNLVELLHGEYWYIGNMYGYYTANWFFTNL